jgi:radical SAM protein with 4Fe4S-binding SPASM domain
MNKYEFLIHRQKQDDNTINKLDSTDPMSSLLSVQFNTTELCNRTCIFCPRVDPNIYPNRNLHLTVETTEKICNDLANVNFLGRISVSGFGEPFLNKQLFEIVSIIKQILPNNIVDVNTNGDQLTVDNICTSFASGLDLMYVNLYDGPEQIIKFTELFNNAGIQSDKYILREHWPNIDNTYNLILNNRGGTLSHINEPIKQKCYFPFSKAMIDYNGDLLLCPQDWSRSYIIGSLLEYSIKDLWLGDRMKYIRTKLMSSDRSSSPCNQCDSDGTLTGLYSFKTLTNYYKNVQIS